jgi:hypothetical protein
MKQPRRLLFFTLLAFPGLAYAYIDPGTGSLLLQGLIAALVSVMIFWRNLRMSIVNFFCAKKHKKAPVVSLSEKTSIQSDSNPQD